MVKASSPDIKDFWTKLSVSPQEAYGLLHMAVESHTTAMMWGSYGVGKTSVVNQLANALKSEKVHPDRRFEGCITFNPSQTDIVDFKVPTVKACEKTGELLAHFAYNSQLPRKGKWILFVDEINTAPQSLQPTLYSLILEKRIGDFRLPDGCVCFAAGNREEDQCAAQPMSNALKDRMGIHMLVEPTSESWIPWAIKNRIRTDIQAWVSYCPGDSLRGHDKNDPTGGCTPRSLEALSKMMDTLERQNMLNTPMESIVMHGAIGQAAASTFAGFLKIYRSQISIDDIIKNPTKAAVPEALDRLYCVTYALAERMTPENAEQIFKYLYRLPPTYMVLAINTARHRDSRLWMGVPCIKDFVTKNINVML